MKNLGSNRTLIAYALLFAVAVFAAGCGGGSSGTSNDTAPTTPSPTPTPTATTLILSADAGSVCETYVIGYPGTPSLSCHNDPNDTNPKHAFYKYNTDTHTAYLDGSGSTTSGGAALTYAWSFTTTPKGSALTNLQNDTTATPSFVPDVAGTYVVQLVVSSQGVTSARSLTSVFALDATVKNPIATYPGYYPYHGGVSNNCVQCHFDGNSTTLLAKSGNHIATSNVCQACHTPIGFKTVSFVDHDEVFGKCSSCHNGVTATGKSAYHLVTSAECDVCHTTTSFLTLSANGQYDHTNITEPCSACHGVTAIGTSSDPVGHLSIGSTECNACHTTVSFKTPYVNHNSSAVIGQCNDCHTDTGSKHSANSNAMLQTATHPDTTGVSCDICHNVVSFKLNGLFDHAVLARHPVACAACHDGVNATGVPAITSSGTSHIDVSSGPDCGSCHNTRTFVGGFVDHSKIDFATQPCVSCHNGTTLGANGIPITGMPSDPIHDPFVTPPDCGQCHTPGGSFLLATVDHSGFGNVPTSDVCSNCHNGTTATGKPGSHIPTTQDCGQCHDPHSDTFKNASAFDHSTLTAGTRCDSCHDGNTATGRSVLHVPTTAIPASANVDCAACHVDTAGFTSFVISTFNHGGTGATQITDNCASCHNGKTYDTTLVIGKPTKFVVNTSTKETRAHISTTNDCSQCHNDTTNGPGINGVTGLTGFASASLFDSAVHKQATALCSSCHDGYHIGADGMNKNAAKFTNHVPTKQECNKCHVNTITDGFLAANSIFAHQGITGNCVSCHDGIHETSGVTKNVLGKNDAPAPGHIHTAADCNSCHLTTGTDFKNAYVDHTSTTVTSVRCDSCHDGKQKDGQGNPILGKKDAVPTHVVTAEDCGVCHVPGGSFKSLAFDHSAIASGTRCDSCHNNGPTATAIGYDATIHITIQTNSKGVLEDCGDCHNTTSFTGTQFDHSTVSSSTPCSSCHDGTTATGMPAGNHVPTSQDCRVCHVTTGFLPGTFDHAGPETVGKQCMDCHDNVIAKGKTPNHVVTNQDCSACHDTAHHFLNATSIDHSTITSGCADSSCHGIANTSGTTTTASYKNHIAIINAGTEVDCFNCHTTNFGVTFSGATMNHSVVPVSTFACSSCHNNVNATGQATKHYELPVKQQSNKVFTCDTCHNTTDVNWTPSYTNHASGSNYPGKHSTSRISATACTKCHKDKPEEGDIPSFESSTYTPSCAACHSGNYSKGAASSHTDLSTDRDCAGKCHNGSGPHHRVSSSSF